MSFEIFFGNENVCSAFHNSKTVKNITKEANKARVIDVKIRWISNNRYPITKSLNRTPLIGYPRDRVPIR